MTWAALGSSISSTRRLPYNASENIPSIKMAAQSEKQQTDLQDKKQYPQMPTKPKTKGNFMQNNS